MRRTFVEEIGKYDVTIITADLGYGLFSADNKKVINIGASEQAMLGIGIGYALEKRKVICYSITPFLLYRPFEWLRYIDRHGISVILAGSGRGDNYSHDGESHTCHDDKKIMDCLENFKCYFPDSKEAIPGMMNEIINSMGPVYINLKR